jgi:lysophospholipase L1-like esterase
MVVGDSISQGSSGDYTWRFWLYEHLVSDGVHPQMVGPYTELKNNVKGVRDACSYADPRFETASDATWGQSLATAITTIRHRVSVYHPGYLLVLIGVDDLGYGITSLAGAEANLKTFIAQAREASPHIRIVIGRLLRREREPAALTTQIAQYNADLPAITRQLSSHASPVVVADDTSAIDLSTDLWDGSHPNAEGEIKIAAGFARALALHFGLGSPYPTPLPTVPTGPIVAPRLTATAGNGQARLAWTLTPGATGYIVGMKDMTAGDPAFTALPLPLPARKDPWIAGDLVNGSTYQFRLQACKGVNCHAFSSTVTVRPTGPVPAAPAALAVTAGNGRATLSWTAAASATGYYVYEKDISSGATAFTMVPDPVPGTSWTVSGLANGATYKFELQSLDGVIRGGTTAPVQVTPEP